MIPSPIHRDEPIDQAKIAKARHRTFEFARSNTTDQTLWTIKTDGEADFGRAATRHRSY